MAGRKKATREPPASPTTKVKTTTKAVPVRDRPRRVAPETAAESDGAIQSELAGLEVVEHEASKKLAPIATSSLDYALTAQLVVAWAGETGEEGRLRWW